GDDLREHVCVAGVGGAVALEFDLLAVLRGEGDLVECLADALVLLGELLLEVGGEVAYGFFAGAYLVGRRGAVAVREGVAEGAASSDVDASGAGRYWRSLADDRDGARACRDRLLAGRAVGLRVGLLVLAVGLLDVPRYFLDGVEAARFARFLVHLEPGM